MTLLSKSSKGSSSPPTYSKLSANGLNEFNQAVASGIEGGRAAGNGGGVYSAMNGSSVGLTESMLNNNLHAYNQNANQNHHGSNTHATHTLASRLEQNTNSSTRNHNQQPHHHTNATNYSSSSNNKNVKSKKFHLIKSNDMISNTTPNIKGDKSKQEIAAKLVSEVYLTRLLATKVFILHIFIV